MPRAVTPQNVVICCEQMKTLVMRKVVRVTERSTGKTTVAPVMHHSFEPQYEGEYDFIVCPFCEYDFFENDLPMSFDSE